MLLGEFLAAGAPSDRPYAVAGQVVSGLVAPALRAGFGVVIVGGAVSESDDPGRAWSSLLDEVASDRPAAGGPDEHRATASG